MEDEDTSEIDKAFCPVDREWEAIGSISLSPELLFDGRGAVDI
jgi:hypothetical protein